MSLYAAIDLHSTNSVLAILDEADVPVRQRRLPNDLPTILRELEPFRDESPASSWNRRTTGIGWSTA